MSVIHDAVAIDHGKEVQIKAIDRNGYDVSFKLKKDEYLAARSILTDGVPVTELRNVITPSDIVGYLYESNPEAQNVMVEVEVQRGLRSKMSGLWSNPIAVGGSAAAIIIALVIAYAVLGDGGSNATGIASNVASGVAIT